MHLKFDQITPEKNLTGMQWYQAAVDGGHLVCVCIPGKAVAIQFVPEAKAMVAFMKQAQGHEILADRAAEAAEEKARVAAADADAALTAGDNLPYTSAVGPTEGLPDDLARWPIAGWRFQRRNTATGRWVAVSGKKIALSTIIRRRIIGATATYPWSDGAIVWRVENDVAFVEHITE